MRVCLVNVHPDVSEKLDNTLTLLLNHVQELLSRLNYYFPER